VLVSNRAVSYSLNKYPVAKWLKNINLMIFVITMIRKNLSITGLHVYQVRYSNELINAKFCTEYG